MISPETIKTLSACFDQITSDSSRTALDLEALKSFRARAREIPTLLFSRGLPYTIVYIASRSDKRTFIEVRNASNCNDLLKKVKEIISQRRAEEKAEEKGYIMYGALLTFALTREGAFTNAERFSDIINEAYNPIVDTKAQHVAEWLKRLAEAYVES